MFGEVVQQAWTGSHGGVIQQKRKAGRRKDGGIVHSVKNDYYCIEQEELKVNEHKILKHI